MISILSVRLFALPDAGLVHDSVRFYVWDPDQNIWRDSSKQICLYDANMNLVESSSWLWNPETGEWVGKEGLSRQIQKYNEFVDLIEILKYQWDIVTGEWILAGGSRREITYDQNSNVILEIFSDYYPVIGKWIPVKKIGYLFNADNEITERSCYTWNKELLEWEGDNSLFRQTWTYNNKGENVCHIYYSWNLVTREWEAFSRFDYNYDTNGKIIEKIQWKWDMEAMTWTGIMRHTWTYYLSPGHSEVILYNWNPYLGNWFPVKLEASMYDEDGHITSYAEYSWDDQCFDWKSCGQAYACIYDNTGNMSEKTIYHWDGYMNTYIQSGCSKYSYDQYGNQTDSCYFSWDAFTSSWIGQGRKVCKYDNDGNLIQILFYQWDIADKGWDCYRKEISYYDVAGKRIDWQRYAWDTSSNEWIGSCPECINIANNPCFMIFDDCGRTSMYTKSESDPNGRRETRTELHFKWDFDDRNWDYTWKKVEYWSESLTDLNDKYTLNTEDCTIFPNPFHEYADIILPDNETAGTIEVMDSRGRIIRIIHFTSGLSIRMGRDNIPDGIYFIRINSNNIYVKKVIIQ